MKRILIVLDSLKMGGAERQALNLILYLKRKYHVEVLAFKDGEELKEFLNINGVPFSLVNIDKYSTYFQLIKYLVKLLKAIKRSFPDIIIPYTYSPNLYCNLIIKVIRSATCVWNQRDEGRGMYGGRLERFALANAKVIISNSEIGADFLRRNFLLEKEIIIIRNSIEISIVNREQAWQRKIGIRPKQIVVGMIANIHKYKDHMTLLRTWNKIVKKKEEDVILLIAGDYYMKDSKIFDLLLTTPQVKYLGKVEDVQGLLSVIDIFVHSSKKEGTPNAVLEAMLYGLPVVASDIPGHREILGGDYEGLFSGEEQCFEKLLGLIESSSLRKCLGEKNKMVVKDQFSIRNLEKYESVIHQCIER